MENSLWLLRNTLTGQEYTVPPEGLRVGRTTENDIALDDDQVSRHHTTLWAQGGQLHIRDENSTNGTWVNEERVTGSPTLQPGNHVRIGESVFEVIAGGPLPAPVEPPVPASKPLPVVPIAIAGGTVLLILVALLLRAVGGGTTPEPTEVITPVIAPTIKVVPTETPTQEPTFPVEPTEAPTLVPLPQITQPELVMPEFGKEYQSPITFQWNGALGAGQMYQVTLRHPGSDSTRQSGLLTDQKWIDHLPGELFGEWYWSVAVVKDGEVLATSEEWMFWFQPFPQSDDSKDSSSR